MAAYDELALLSSNRILKLLEFNLMVHVLNHSTLVHALFYSDCDPFGSFYLNSVNLYQHVQVNAYHLSD